MTFKILRIQWYILQVTWTLYSTLVSNFLGFSNAKTDSNRTAFDGVIEKKVDAVV